MNKTTDGLIRKAGTLRKAWLTGLTMLLLSPGIYAQNQGAEALADKMLQRLGGRAAWAGLRNTINGSQQNRAEEPTVVYAVITMDFQQPRFRIETTAQDLHLVRDAFGAGDDNVGTLSGPWDFIKDGIHHPRWVSNPDGTWRAAVKVLDINVPLHDSMFTRPGGK